MTADEGAGEMGARRRRWVLPVVVGVTTLLALFGLGVRVYAFPAVDPAGPDREIDAVVALGGVPRTVETAMDVAGAIEGRRLVVSHPYSDQPWIDDLCRSSFVDQPVICFVPDPSTTRGEAQEIGRLAERNGWDQIAVVTPTFHLSRARYIVRRCYSGELIMVDTGMRPGRRVWAWQFAYQTAGFVKALGFQRGC